MSIYNLCIVTIVASALGLATSSVTAGEPMTKNFYATSPVDAKDLAPGDGVCNALPAQGGQLCTLRAAIMEGNATSEEWDVNVILVSGMTYKLSIAGGNENSAATGDLDVLRPMRIGVADGAAQQAKLDANHVDRMFDFLGSGSSTLYGIDMYNGTSPDDTAAILIFDSTVLLDRLDVHGSLGAKGLGSAIEVTSGAVVRVHESRIYENGNADNIGTAGIQVVAAELVVERSTIDSNSFVGIDAQHFSALTLRSSTISNNYGGVNVFYSTAAIADSTIYRNGNTWQIGVSSLPDRPVALDIRNSILAKGAGMSSICQGTHSQNVTFSSAYNLYGDQSCVSDTLVDHSEHNVTDFGLSEFGDWGGPTPSYKPLPGSIAIDHSPGSLCADVDQRGLPRPVAYEGNIEPRCDTGAVELAPIVPPDEPWVAEIFRDGFEDEG